MSRATVVCLPGFNGRADQPVLVKLCARLEAMNFTCVRLAPPRMKVTPGLEAHVAWLEEALRELEGPLVLVGRSFGGRLAIRVSRSDLSEPVEDRPAKRSVSAARGPSSTGSDRPAAIVLLGFPIRPPGKQRPLDEAALSAVTCPLFIAQGTKDELGPLKVVKQFAPRATLFEVKGAGHSFGAKEKDALDAAAAWLDQLAW